jgi:hypothetical protein
VSANYKDWDNQLSLIEFCYNSTKHSTIGANPFELAIMDRLQTSGELQDKTSFIDPSTGVDLLKSYSPDYLLL